MNPVTCHQSLHPAAPHNVAFSQTVVCGYVGGSRFGDVLNIGKFGKRVLLDVFRVPYSGKVAFYDLSGAESLTVLTN